MVHSAVLKVRLCHVLIAPCRGCESILAHLPDYGTNVSRERRVWGFEVLAPYRSMGQALRENDDRRWGGGGQAQGLPLRRDAVSRGGG